MCACTQTVNEDGIVYAKSMYFVYIYMSCTNQVEDMVC